LCSQCHERVEARVFEREQQVWMDKHCPQHGSQEVLISTDAEFYLQQRNMALRAGSPQRTNTETIKGCPFDCGICPDHKQHSCITLLEVTSNCNLSCPICYADSSPRNGGHRDLDTLCRMLDDIVLNEGQPDVVQISGGEPTTHPQILEILAAARARPIRHLMLNTNGLRIAQSAEFAEKLKQFTPGFEVYLQFDSLNGEACKTLRGRDLVAEKRRALDRLEALGLSTTLVVTVQRGVNDQELGSLIEFALGYRCVRGLTLQPVQHAGRATDYDPARHRLTLSEVRQAVLDQHPLFAPADIVPVPCHPDCLAMAYALKLEGRATALTGLISKDALIEAASDTITLEKHPAIRRELNDLLSAGHSPESAAAGLGRLLCCLPDLKSAASLSYENVFRVMIVQFMDADSLDVRSVKRSCITIANPDGRVIPFDTYNLFYREGLSLPASVSGNTAHPENPVQLRRGPAQPQSS
jgi:uncharacterized radical SAM superfamily Fe-S cluster-containing enzyme